MGIINKFIPPPRVAAAASGGVFADPNLEGWYHLEGLTDSSGKGRTLTNVNSVAFVSGGHLSNCADFGASNTTKTLNVANTMGISGDMSFGSWVNVQTAPGSGTSQTFMCQEVGSLHAAFRIEYWNNGGTLTLRGVVLHHTVVENFYDYVTTLNVGTWYNVGFTWNNTSKAINLYLTGSSVASGTDSGSYGAYSPTDQFNLGADSDPVRNFSKIFQDEAYIYSRVLTGAEMLTISQG